MKPIGRSFHSLLIALLAAALGAAPLRADVELMHSVPAAAAPGQTIDVTFHGKELDDATSLWLSFPATAVKVDGEEAKADQVTFRLTIPESTPLHVGGVRVATARGISNLRPFLIGDLPTTRKAGGNQTAMTAQEIAPGTAVEGHIEATRSDFYRFTAAAGERVSIEVMAQRLGSPLDPYVRLLDAGDRLVADSDDDPAIGSDSRFAVTLREAGSYVIELRDIQHRGGAAFRYRLRLGDFPVASAAFPVGVQKGTTATVTLFDPERGAIGRDVIVPADYSGSRYAVGVGRAGGKGASFVSLVASDLPEEVESEPNDDAQAASPCSLPAGINGRFDAPGDPDWYAFDVEPGVRLRIVGHARSHGSPATLMLRLYNGEGTKLGEAAQTAEDERSLEYTFAAGGTYRLLAEDLHRRGGPEFVYRLQISEYAPGFSLAVDADRFTAPRAGVFVAKVTSQRRGYEGPIALSIDGLPAAAALKDNVIPQGKDETTLHVTLPEELEPGRPLSFTIVGRGDASAAQAGPAVQQVAAVKYDRGNLGIYDGYISDKMAGMNFAEYDVEIPEAGEYVVLLKYAAKSPRPAVLKINGQQAGGPVMSQTTGEWNPATARWFTEGEFAFTAGKNVIRLEKEGVFSHLTEVKVATRSAQKSGSGREISAVAGTLSVLRQQWGGWEHPPADLVGSIGLGVGPPFPPFFQLAAKPGVIRIAKGGDSARFEVQAEKLDGFDDVIMLAVGGLPDGVTAKIEPIAKGKTSAAITLSGTAQLPEGPHKLQISGSATFENQPQTVVLNDVVLQIEPPAGDGTSP